LSACIPCRANWRQRKAWSFEAQAERVIQRFSLDPDALVGTLSGGQKKRLALAQALAISPELLLLDEPTNHLDIGAIEWLEEMLIGSNVSMVFITHDRRFLDRVATRIVELDRGRLLSCPGSFSAYQERKEADAARRGAGQCPFDKFLAQEEVWIRKGVEARRTRNEGRVLRLERLRRERAARRERRARSTRVDAGDKSGQAGGRAGKRQQELWRRRRQDRGARFLLPHAARRQDRPDRRQRRRQDTLLRLILGELAPDAAGALGTKIQVAYFDQFRAQLDPEAALSMSSPGLGFRRDRRRAQST
jgi:ATP-binding cassette subfamily F protein uup